MKANGKTTDPGEETLNALITAHFPNAVDKIRKQYTSDNKYKKQEIDESNSDWINFTLTKEALASFEKKKSPGPDGIKPVLFEHLPDNLSSTWYLFIKV